MTLLSHSARQGQGAHALPPFAGGEDVRGGVDCECGEGLCLRGGGGGPLPDLGERGGPLRGAALWPEDAWGASGDWKIDGATEVHTEDGLAYTWFPVHSASFAFSVKAKNDAHLLSRGGGRRGSQGHPAMRSSSGDGPTRSTPSG